MRSGGKRGTVALLISAKKGSEEAEMPILIYWGGFLHCKKKIQTHTTLASACRLVIIKIKK